MKIVKHYWFVAIALITMISFSSCDYNDELYSVYKFDWEIQNGWLYLYYSDGYTFIIEYPSVSGRYFYGTAEDGFEIRLEWVDGRSIRKK